MPGASYSETAARPTAWQVCATKEAAAAAAFCQPEDALQHACSQKAQHWCFTYDVPSTSWENCIISDKEYFAQWTSLIIFVKITDSVYKENLCSRTD